MKKKLIVLLLALMVIPYNAKAFSLTVVTDIHAGSQKKRKQTDRNVIYPKKYNRFVRKMVSETKSDYYLTLGDNTNKGDSKYARKLKSILPSGTLYTKGNHDGEGWDEFKKSNYYYQDIDNWRIIVLCSDLVAKETGGIDKEQFGWLKDKLDTDKNTIVSMHHPIYKEDGEFTNKDLKEVFETKGVDYVFAGHTHAWEKKMDINGVKYFSLQALTLKGGSGYYKTFNLD